MLLPVFTFIHLRVSQLLRSLHKPLKGSSTVDKPICHAMARHKPLVPLLFRYDLAYDADILNGAHHGTNQVSKGMPLTYEPKYLISCREFSLLSALTLD